jgi:hypothetical protein
MCYECLLKRAVYGPCSAHNVLMCVLHMREISVRRLQCGEHKKHAAARQ